MISNKHILDCVKEALTSAFKSWLNDNRGEIVRLVADSVRLQDKKAEPTSNDKQRYYTPTQIARRWNFHVGSMLRLLRSGELPTMRIGRRVLVPVAVVEKYEADTTFRRSS
jgi:excisionase family DNA binding protein